jgi:signal transduction histidine kinase
MATVLFELKEATLAHRQAIGWITGGVALLFELTRRARALRSERRADRRIRAELEAYARLDARMPEDGDVRALGRRVCQVVSEVSAFRTVAMLTRETDGRLLVAAELGMEASLVEALNQWGERTMRVGPRLRRESAKEDSSGGRSGRASGVREAAGVRAWTRSLIVQLQLAHLEIAHSEQRSVLMVPLWTTAGRILGALVVSGSGSEGLRETVPLESLAAKLGRTMENAALAERLLRSEKLAGLGQLAGGVAHALNNPLTAVLGFAELIAETTEEMRVHEDATTIVREATRMRETVQSLLDLWRPATLIDEAIHLGDLVRELSAACGSKLESRGVRLVVEAAAADSYGEGAVVRGSRDRLRQVMEHLLNNSAQAIAIASGGHSAGHAIRVTVREDERGVQVIVSDTGTGFVEPARVFDPFYTRQHAGEGAGLGLSICYGIVREHGGEISAFNLHPRGAAVVVELPIGRAVVSAEALVLCGTA